MYDANIIAQYIIDYCRDKGRPVSNLKLQKILYFVQAQFLAYMSTACFYNHIEAWEFGPVVPDVYRQYRVFGNSPITMSFGRMADIIVDRDKSVINNIVDICNKYTTASLVKLTHSQAPWLDARRRGHNAEITQEAIRDYFLNR